MRELYTIMEFDMEHVEAGSSPPPRYRNTRRAFERVWRGSKQNWPTNQKAAAL